MNTNETKTAKRLFQVLDEMNILDIKNGGRLVEASGNFISADKIKQGAKISMGTPEHSLNEIMTGKKIPVLLLIDAEEYNKRKQS